MNEKLYQLLNNDASELPKAKKISNQEVNNIMKRFREETGAMPIKKRRKPIKVSVVILAAVIAACGGTTVFAATHSNLFKNLESNKTKTYIDDSGTERKLDKYHPDLNNYEMLESFASTEAETEVSGNNEISVSIESTYCDGRTLVLGLTGSLNNGNPDGYRYVGFDSIKIDCGDVVFDTENRMNPAMTWFEGNMMLDEGTENSFSGQITLKLLEDHMLTESKNAVITLKNLCVGDNYLDSVKLNDTVVIKKRIVVDKALINGTAIQQSEDGYKVRLSNYSPASIHVEWEYPSDLNEENGTKHIIEDGFEYDIPLYAMILGFYDEDGNELHFLNETIGTGSLTTPSSDIIYARILNKQENTGSDLYYGMPVYKEFKFDLSELKNEE